jgi:putative hemolysin
MGGYWLTIALLLLLTLINALFAGSEIALISLRDGQLRRFERRGGASARALLRLARNPNQYLATIQIGITVSGFLASAVAAVTLAEPLIPLLGFLGPAARPLAVTLVTAILAFINLVASELVPKRLAMQYAERWALLVARPLYLLSVMARPAVWALSKATDFTVRLLGGDPGVTREQLTPEELRDLVAGHRALSPEQRDIIMGALEIHERTLREVMVPRRAVFTLPADIPAHEAATALAAAGHSRAPVVRNGNLDDVVGVVALRDLLDNDRTVAELARTAMVLPDTMLVIDALRLFKAERQQFALVANEHGSIDGIVTLEDLLEEIVGEIYDESDRDVLAVRTEPDGALLVPGTFPIHELPDIDVEITDAPEGDYTTVAGLVLTALGHIPERPGECVQLADWTLEVAALSRYAITAVRLRRRGAS